MRTTIDLDKRLVDKGIRLSGCRTTKDLVHQSIETMVRLKEQERFLNWRGKIRWRGNLAKLRGDAA